MKRERVLTVVALGAIAVYFAVSAADGLNAYFSFDDGGNLVNFHQCFESSAGSALKGLIDGSYRPMGGIYYLTLYRLTGFHPEPFRAVCFGLLLINVGLAFAVLRRLSGRVEAAFLGTVLLARHPAFLNMDYSAGFIYEILCFLFYFLALWCYLGWRQSCPDTPMSWRRIGILLLLSACALDSKEMAVTLPFALLLVEVVFYRPLSSVRRNLRAAIAVAALTVVAMLQKLLTFNELSADPRYRMHFSPHLMLDQMCRYYDVLLYQDHFLTIPGLLLLWTLMALAAYGMRSRPMQFGFWFSMLSLLPMSLIAPRSDVALYLPGVGWALFLAAFVVRLCDAAFRRPAMRFATLAAAAVLIVVWHEHRRAPLVALFHRQQNAERTVMRQLQERYPRFDRGSYLLFLDDPFSRDSWSLLFFTRLAYADPTIWLDRVTMLGGVPSSDELTLYDHIFTDDGGQLREIGLSKPREPEATIAVHFSPARVKPGESYTVFAPQCAGETIDVAFETRRRGFVSTGMGRRWCTLDSSGRVTLTTPDTMEAGEIQIRKIRMANGPWMPAEGAIEVVR